MLPTENPPPIDLCEISQVKSVVSDERTSGNHQFEVDLFKPGLDDNNPLPKFSIRDYVLSTRCKDIKNNWPFSQKNLQLCLKHGVKDVLPPFQSLDSARNQPIAGCAVEKLSNYDVKHSESSDDTVCGNLAVDIEKINPSESQGDKEFPSTTTSQSCLQPEAVHLPTSPTKPEFAVRGPDKVGSNVQSPVKKCRLIVKLNNIAEPKPNEDLAVNSCVVSEAMASKVCPVCKTFSSSSNTTLNAHIDQCLAGESSSKWTANSKVIKHRIKPRKTRLMVDIYETALRCTLEDLDRRNGTNWALNLGPPSQDLEAGPEEEKKRHSSVNGEDINQEGDVYIDSSGTKLRILSKMSHLPLEPNGKDDSGAGFGKRDEGRKLLSSKKKKYGVQKHKLQKLFFDGQGSCSPISFEVDNGRQKLFHSDSYEEDDSAQPLVASDQTKSDDFGMITKWVGSKRTGLKKKVNLERENEHRNKSMKNFKVKSVSSLVDTLSKGNAASISPVSLDEIPDLPTGSHKRKENSVCNSPDGYILLSHQRKRPAFPLLKSQHLNDKKNHRMFSKFAVKQSRKDISSVHEHNMDPPNCTENHVSSRYNKKLGKDGCSFIGPNTSQNHKISYPGKKFASLRKTSSGHTVSSGSKKFSSLRAKLSSFRHAPVTESRTSLGRKLLKLKNSMSHYTSGSDEETRGRIESHLEKGCGKPSINRTRVLKIEKKIRGIMNIGEGDMTSESLESSGNIPVDTSNDLEEDSEMPDEFVSRPTFGIPNGEAFVSFSKSLDSSAFPGLDDSSNVDCGSHFYNPDELALNGDQDRGVAEMDADEGRGDYFVDVDPIPIPGPPGSFLPSPGRMGSEELQGHSSLTTCRIQSSEEGHDVVDMDSSDSPISAISVASDSTAARSNPISIANLSEPSHFPNETRCDISQDGKVANGDGEVDLMVPEVAMEAQNVQPCCCSRKDGYLQGDSFNFQDSQILRRRSMNCETQSKEEITQEPEKHAANSPIGYAPLVVSCNSETMFPPCGDSESSSPSTPNPVLRLMGKNLMVVNNDENPSPQTRPIQSSMAIDHPGPRSCAENGVSTNQNELISFQHNLSRGPSTFNHLKPGIPVQHFDFNSSNGFKALANCGPPPFSAYPSTAMFSDTNGYGYGYANGFNLITDQHGFNIRLDPQITYDTAKVCTPVHHLKTAESSGKRKEIIIIDDSPESDTGLPVNPFYSYQSRVYNRFTGSPTGNTSMPPSKGITANLGKWNCIPEGSSVFRSNSSSASLPSTAHLRSSVYFSPGFS